MSTNTRPPALLSLFAAMATGATGCHGHRTAPARAPSGAHEAPASSAAAPAVPGTLAHFPGLSDRRPDGTIVDAPEADQALARSYPSAPGKGAVQHGLRLTLLTHRRTVRIGEEIRVLHVLEATEPGREVWVMGPKRIYGEHVDGRLATAEPPDRDYPWLAGEYDGRVLPSPAVDYNYEITTYRFSVAGRHQIEWRLGDHRSNVLELTVEADPAPSPPR